MEVPGFSDDRLPIETRDQWVARGITSFLDPGVRRDDGGGVGELAGRIDWVSRDLPGFGGICVRAFLTNIADAYDDGRPPIPEQRQKLHDKVPYTGTDPFEFVVHQGSFQSDTAGGTYRRASEFFQTPLDTRRQGRAFSTQSKQQIQGVQLPLLGGIRISP